MNAAQHPDAAWYYARATECRREADALEDEAERQRAEAARCEALADELARAERRSTR
jgi:hypothetical protein